MKTKLLATLIGGLLFIVHGASALAATDQQANLSQQANNPIANMISVPLQYSGNFNIGPHDRNQHVFTIQPVIPFELSEDWLLVTRWVLPIIDQPDISDNSDSTFGIGDLNPALFFSPSSKLTGLPKEFMFGFGPNFSVPTSSDSDLGSNKWGIGPTVLGVYSKDKLQVGALTSNTWSLGDGGDEINAFLFEPWIGYNITDEWYVLSDMVITADWNAPSSERWVVPVGGGFGKTFEIGKQAMNSNLQAYVNVGNSADEAGPDWNLVFTLQFLFPK